MDEDILADLERQLTNVNLDKYWPRKVGDFELWLAVIDYTQSNRVKKVLDGEFGLEEAKRVTLSAAIVGVNGVDLRPLRQSGKTIKVSGRDGRKELVDLPEFMYRKIANWDVEFVDTVFEVYSDIIESHKKDLVKDLVFENSKSPEEELEELEEKAASLRERLGRPPMVEAARLTPEPVGDAPPDDPVTDDGGDDDGGPVDPGGASSSFVGPEEDFDPFEHVKSVRQKLPSVPDLGTPPVATSPVPVPVPPPRPGPPSAIEEAMARRGAPLPPVAPPAVRPPSPFSAQPSVPSEVIESGAPRVTVDPPSVNPASGSQSKNPRFRRAGGHR